MNDSTDSAASEPPIRVLSSSLSAEELAAVTVVVDAAVEEELDELQSTEAQAAAALRAPSAWERSQRSLREPVHPDAGAWRAFSG